MSEENISKIVKILKRLGYGVRHPVDPMGLADAKTRKSWIVRKNMKVFNFYKGDGLEEVDIIIKSPVSYEKARRTAVFIKAGTVRLPVISIDNLIKMKKKAGRSVDKLDIEELKKIKQLRKRI